MSIPGTIDTKMESHQVSVDMHFDTKAELNNETVESMNATTYTLDDREIFYDASPDDSRTPTSVAVVQASNPGHDLATLPTRFMAKLADLPMEIIVMIVEFLFGQFVRSWLGPLTTSTTRPMSLSISPRDMSFFVARRVNRAMRNVSRQVYSRGMASVAKRKGNKIMDQRIAFHEAFVYHYGRCQTRIHAAKTKFIIRLAGMAAAREAVRKKSNWSPFLAQAERLMDETILPLQIKTDVMVRIDCALHELLSNFWTRVIDDDYEDEHEWFRSNNPLLRPRDSAQGHQ